MFKQNTPVMSLILIFCVSCSAPTVTPTPTATIAPTAIQTPSPTLTFNPYTHGAPHRDTNFYTNHNCHSRPEQSKQLENLLVTNRKIGLKWRNDWVGYEVRFIFPGVGAISDIPLNLKDGEGAIVGKAFASLERSRFNRILD